MGDGLRLSKDKRHRSSSSIAGTGIDGTRSERKLDIRASIQEVDDQFHLAEKRCNDLQEKIDLVKGLKRKRKLKKRSMTRVAEHPTTLTNIPVLTVHTQPIKKISQPIARPRRLEIPPNPTRGYLDAAMLEQHQMLGQVQRGYHHLHTQPKQDKNREKPPNAELKSAAKPLQRARRTRPDGANMVVRGQRLLQDNSTLDVACGDDGSADYSDNDGFDQQPNDLSITVKKNIAQSRIHKRIPIANRRRFVPKDLPPKEASKWQDGTKESNTEDKQRTNSPTRQRRQINVHLQPKPGDNETHVVEERPVVELFNKSRGIDSPDIKNRRQSQQQIPSPELKTRKIREGPKSDEGPAMQKVEEPLQELKKEIPHRPPHRIKYRSRRYELPTVASQMKQAGMRYYHDTANRTNIPFVVSKSTAPSHNIGVNIQQVLNGLKIQQPLTGIPLTIAHHMGLGHVPYCSKNLSSPASVEQHKEINAIRVGQRVVRLPSYKYMSYSRMLTLYREGDGMVPRFLKSISRPHYFYTSMYNLATNRDDYDGATLKGRGSQEAKQSLAEYASLYREYEQIVKCLKEGQYDPEWERRKEELTRELAAREQHIRKVVQDYRTSEDVNPAVLRASASTAEDGYRQSAFKINLGDQHL